MEVALNSILIFFFIIFPGIVFRRVYFQGEFTKQFNSSTISDSIFKSIIPGILIQVVTLYSYQKFFGSLNGQDISDFYKKMSNNNLPEGLFSLTILMKVLMYFSLLMAFAIILGMLFWIIVRYLKLDRRMPLFRFNNHWNYYFKGEIQDFKEFKGQFEGKVLLTLADVLMRVEGDKNRLYSGVVTQYTISMKDNSLESIYLTKVSRYKKDEKEGMILRDIPGECMIIPYSNVVNINLRYLCADKKVFNSDRVLGFFLLFGMLVILLDFKFLVNNAADINVPLMILKTIAIKIFSILNWAFLLVLIKSLIEYGLKARQLSLSYVGIIIVLSVIIYQLVS